MLIQPEKTGIVGAPAVSERFCHCEWSSSQGIMGALNPVKAAVGDRIAIEVKASALIRNVGSLMGMPVLALPHGWVVPLFLKNSHLFGVPITFV